MACEGEKEISFERVVDVDGMVIGGGDDAVVREDETGDDRGTVSRKRKVFWGRIGNPFCTGEHARFEEGTIGVRERS